MDFMNANIESVHASAPEKTPAPALSNVSVAPPPDATPFDFTPARGESERAFEAYRVYLELGPHRRYAAVGRQVGAGLRTIKRWAVDFDWRGRIQAHAARSAEQFVQAESAVQREVLLDAAARAQAFRDRQYYLAEAILDVAERQLEQMDAEDPDQVSITDVCKALEVASRLARQARETGTGTAPDQNLRDHLAALLDQVVVENPKPAC
jgi:adenosyl cobinamide kinase/adenosyl cobinamide phosphate guanylyltransferase